jgi:hypothetical protein
MPFTPELTIGEVPVSLLSVDDIGGLYRVKENKRDTWLLDMFFPNRITSETGRLAITDIETHSPIAPFVNHCVEGKPIDSGASASVEYFSFPYLKPKEAISPCTVLDDKTRYYLNLIRGRQGKMTDEEAYVAAQIRTYGLLQESIDNRINAMAVELFTTGKLEIVSDDHDRMQYDFKRDATATYTPAKTWDDPTATPVQDINDMIAAFGDLNDMLPRAIVTTTKVWNALVKHHDFNDNFVAPYAGIKVPFEIGFDTSSVEPAQFRGYAPQTQIQIWTYDGKFTKKDGSKQRYLPENFFAVVGDGGTVAQGPIRNLLALGSTEKYYMSQWIQNDPSVLFMMAESSPLVIPSSSNMVVSAAVLP